MEKGLYILLRKSVFFTLSFSSLKILFFSSCSRILGILRLTSFQELKFFHFIVALISVLRLNAPNLRLISTDSLEKRCQCCKFHVINVVIMKFQRPLSTQGTVLSHQLNRHEGNGCQGQGRNVGG